MDPRHIAFERRGSGRPLVLLHGLGDRRQSWRSVAPRLTDDYEVVSVDLPGFGESPAPTADEPYDVHSLVRVIREFCELHGFERPHLAGNSLGGSIALELGVQQVAGSVTVFSPCGFSDNLARWGMRTVGVVARLATHIPMPVKERLAETAPARAAARIALRGDPSSPGAKATRFGVQGLEPGAPYVRMVPRIAEYDFAPRPIACPVTVAWGDHDRTLLPSSARHAHERVPTARMVSLIGAGHIPMADDPLAVAEQIRWTCHAGDRGGHRAR
ncbi:alpha/beta fold hydrolase [Nocardiopsis sp. MG754419]|uniref:alpha/beta fold hydrolase n=1 Tax=Nocardiopsis sp. MG754419 TaxID=2259865 RepID=UPI001BA9E8AD|nr:alpha/beta hydrolase [Nocardiopsis sp. MG754419]MBR8744501.1 alpha/beta hydrolase [Nocardiopsis sp. MG754419]